MRFKVFMINDLGNFHEETIIANNVIAAKKECSEFQSQFNVIKKTMGLLLVTNNK